MARSPLPSGSADSSRGPRRQARPVPGWRLRLTRPSPAAVTTHSIHRSGSVFLPKGPAQIGPSRVIARREIIVTASPERWQPRIPQLHCSGPIQPRAQIIIQRMSQISDTLGSLTAGPLTAATLAPSTPSRPAAARHSAPSDPGWGMTRAG
jgi:hypothetical protein